MTPQAAKETEALLLSDRITYKGNEIPLVLRIIQELKHDQEPAVEQTVDSNDSAE